MLLAISRAFESVCSIKSPDKKDKNLDKRAIRRFSSPNLYIVANMSFCRKSGIYGIRSNNLATGQFEKE
jgi:hypothetical protein